MSIHPTAVVSSAAAIESEVSIGPFAVVEAGVEIGRGCTVAAQAVLKAGVQLADEVSVHEGAVLGGAPQDLKFQDVPSFVRIGSRTVVREMVTVHRSAIEGGITTVGEDCFLMASSHVAHDCQLASGVLLGGFTALAGHIEVGSRAFISGGVVMHQFSRVGELSMVGGGSKVNLDTPPFITVDGFPARAIGLNTVGLKRAGFEPAVIRELKQAYRYLFRSKLRLEQALEKLDELPSQEVATLAAFIRRSERGICRERPRRP